MQTSFHRDSPANAPTPESGGPRRPIRHLTSAASALLLGVTVALAGGTVLAPAAQASSDPAGTDLRIVTLNIRHDLGPQAWARDAATATTVADVASFQELEDVADRDAMVAALRDRNWNVWYPHSFPRNGGQENTVAWDNSRFRFVSGTAVKTHGAIRLVTPERFVNTVVLRDRGTGRTFAVVNTHTISRAAPQGGRVTNARTAYLRRHLSIFRQAIERARSTTPLVFATGDLNVDYFADRRYRVLGLPTRTLAPVARFDMPNAASWKDVALFDYVMSARGPGQATRTGGYILKGLGTDHWGVVVSYAARGISALTPPVAVFRPGSFWNDPAGDEAARRRVLDFYVSAIEAAPAASAIHLTSTRVDDTRLRDALLAAQQRGVNVQVVLRNLGVWTPDELALSQALGQDTTAGTWATACGTTCQQATVGMSSSTLLVSRAGKTDALRLGSIRGLEPQTSARRTRINVVTDLESYDAAFGQFFALLDPPA